MYRALDSTITREFIERRGTRTLEQVATKLSRKTGLSPRTEMNFISRLEAGEIASTCVHYVRERISKSNLEKLTAYLLVLKVKPEDPLIEKLKDYCSNFKYSISSSRKPRRQYAPR